MSPKAALQRIVENKSLSYDEMVALMGGIMGGEVSPVMIAGILCALRMRRETVDEVAAAASVMRELSTRVAVSDTTHLVDTCGTGGDGAHTFNISTAAMFVAAAAGARVAKHGGRSVSSSSGSADVLEALGVNINLTPEQVGQCVDQVGLGFMFAPNHHSAMKHAAPVRRELGVRTLFNMLGPLTNPAGAPNQVMGVFSRDIVGLQARVLQRLGSRHAMVVFGENGLDEISISGPTLVGELKDGEVREYRISPADVGLPEHDMSALHADSAATSATMLRGALQGSLPAARDVVVINAGASLYVSGVASSLQDGVQRAQDVIASGAALAKLDALVRHTQQLSAT